MLHLVYKSYFILIISFEVITKFQNIFCYFKKWGIDNTIF